MDRGSASQNSRMVEEVFRDIKNRRAGILKALTTDFEDFYQQCDPAKENLCLYGYPDEQWEVSLPAEEVPPEIPEPVLGINFARDGMEKKPWLSLVALHSDAWLLALSSYFSGRFQFDKKHRKLLLDMIADLPTICEVVNGKIQDKTSGSKQNSNKYKSSKLKAEYQAKNSRGKNAKEENEELNEEEDDYLCASCGESSVLDNFWIFCDTCEKWFHGKCVKVTPAKAEYIKNYKCPHCSNSKRIRVS
ncbi:PHD finger protein ALFIN-LIKE 3-like [Zingiber officinale]|uniref:PHD finger protein ALFIN-LIKE 3-like n=1 Tax=Zingiber officinale TaxID=94328 RepID=UPI001C4DAAE9|nr:PHD finger protein ALFIN-LIKE 3-like [Zingiber officinale]